MMHIIDLHFLEHQQAIASFLIETSEGPVLIETGPYSTFSHLKKGIENLGYQVEDVKHVLLTHIHFDHAGAAWAFARHGATIYLHPFGARHMADPGKLVESARRIYKDDMDRLWSDIQAIPEKQLQTVEHEETLHIGGVSFISWHTPGHANHHIAWQIGSDLFTGDVAGVKIGDGPVIPPCPPPDISLEKWKNSLEIIRKIQPAKLYLTHYGEVTEIEAHLDLLEEHLNEYAYWIKERWEQGMSLEEMTPLFEQYIQKELKSKGLNDEALAQYQAANPAWMSVAGLVRYWKKKQEKPKD
ncbi:MBL fold metallo-hydrolase [Rapidithrix thailandica]|uniref:MBL fold metallo-hydrolase n=1 Tax=Rapidithrix thailandica TaxID=413964 RepID=A0AAW9S374_9BACT